MKRSPPNLRRLRGIALIVVLWMLVLLTVVIGTFSVLARTESLQSRFLFDTTDARYAAEAGIHRAVVELRNPDLETRWVADGRPYLFEFGGAEIEVKITDETGLIDINAAAQAQPEMLLNLFESVGVDPQEAQALTDAIQDWVDPDDLNRPLGAELQDYETAGYPYGPADAPFASVDELQQVIGMSWELFRRVEDSLTIHSGRANVNPAFAPLSVLQSLPELDQESARLFIDERSQYHPGDAMQLMLPDGTPVNQRGGGLTHTVESRATLESGTWSQITATIRLGTDSRGRPFRVVRWAENETEPAAAPGPRD
jgi:general secretion pathway protein K